MIRAQNMVLGALVADAAAMGTHWIYDQAHIRKIAPETPEFIALDPNNYEGVPAFFAHQTRITGDQSQYGEQLVVMLKALAANDGIYDPQIYATHFRAHFGYGGAYVGYIDHATRETLNNFQRAEDEALNNAYAIPFDGPRKVTQAMVGKAMALKPMHKGAELRAKFEEAVRMTHDDETIVAHGFKVLDEIIAMVPRYGAQDEQLPAIAKLPALIAMLPDDMPDDAFFATVDSAVRTTNDHERAISFGRICAAMMRAALGTGDMQEIVAAGRSFATPETDALMADALGLLATDSNATTKHFGMACDLNYGVPSVVHNVLTAPSYAEAIRRNIYAGGDTCGRAILVGAIMGAVHNVDDNTGIPQSWLDQLTLDRAVLNLA